MPAITASFLKFQPSFAEWQLPFGDSVKHGCSVMRMLLQFAAVAASLLISVPASAQVVYNSAPSNGFNYGAGNNYTPANAAVLTGPSGEIALRFHQTGQVAPASDGAGV